MARAKNLMECFEDIEDPRIERTKKHELMDIIIMTLCAVIGGAQGWREIRRYAIAKEEWFRTILKLPNGIPSRATFARVISSINAKELEKRFEEWTLTISGYLKRDHVIVDGKKINGSHGENQSPLHFVSAWSANKEVVLANEWVPAGRGELSVLPDLLRILFLKGALVSIDAMGTRKEVAEQILSQRGDYLLALKSNNRNLYGMVKNRFDLMIKYNEFDGFPFQFDEDVDKGHGRLEIRKVWHISIAKRKETCGQWPGLKTIAVIESTREVKGKISTEMRYYISSLELDVKRAAKAIRDHWSIENKLHHCLDVSWKEDGSRVRLKNGRETLAIMRRMALNIFRKDNTYPGEFLKGKL